MGETPKKKTARLKGFEPARNWAPRPRRAVSVGEFVPTLMRPAFEKFGFPAASLLTDWAAIAGPDLAAFTAPERLKWPRNKSGEQDAPEKGATLVLRVAGARALEVEQMRPRLIERINAAFGYRAVGDIRVLQAPLPQPATRAGQRKAVSQAAPVDPDVLAKLPDGPLKGAFERMAAGLKARQKQNKPATVQP